MGQHSMVHILRRLLHIKQISQVNFSPKYEITLKDKPGILSSKLYPLYELIGILCRQSSNNLNHQGS